MEIKSYPLFTCRIEDDKDILFISYEKNLNIDLTDAKQIVADRLEFTGNRAHYLIMEMSNLEKITYEAQLFLQNEHGGLKNILGAAFVTSNPVSVLLSNIFIKTPKGFPAKLFMKKTEALKWIKELKSKKN